MPPAGDPSADARMTVCRHDRPRCRGARAGRARAAAGGTTRVGFCPALPGDAGKTALLDEAVAAAAVAGLRTSRLTGVEPETQLGYAGLRRFLLPRGPTS